MFSFLFYFSLLFPVSSLSPDAYNSSGIFSFAATTFLLSIFNVGTRGVQTPNIVVGMAIFAGGLSQFIAGMWEFPRGNVFGATGKEETITIMFFIRHIR